MVIQHFSVKGLRELNTTESNNYAIEDKEMY